MTRRCVDGLRVRCRQFWLVVALTFAPTALSAAEAPSLRPAKPDPVLIVSIDGLSWQRLQKDRARLPELSRLLHTGTAAPLQTVFPSMTWPAHASLATGVWPARHGVIGNRFFDRARGEVVEFWTRDANDLGPQRPGREPARALWDVAREAGLSTGAMLWPATSRARNLDWNLPEVYGLAAFRRSASPGLLAELAAAGLPVGRLERHSREEAFLLDSWLRDATVYVIARHKPSLLLAHFVAHDTLAHRYGPDSAEAGWGLELADRYLGDLVRAYQGAAVRVLVVSDHGFCAITTGMAPEATLRKARLSRKERAAVRLVHNGHALFVYLTDSKLAAQLAPKVQAVLRAQPEIEKIILPKDFAALGLALPADDAHMPDFIALAHKHVAFWRGTTGGAQPPLAGTHGYLPELPEMQGVFLAAGPGIARATLAGVRVIDVAPSAARLLGVAMPGTDGVALLPAPVARP